MRVAGRRVTNYHRCLRSGGIPLISGCCAATGRDRQAQMAAERVRLIVLAEEAALLKDRDDFAYESVELTGVAQMDVEAVECAAFKPALDFIRHRFG